ncbi:MAG TPA: GspE/PulE family protein [Gaiellaceae bacterium]|nr:GspE/PulE family protein [Gaiellaceae bacterium]
MDPQPPTLRLVDLGGGAPAGSAAAPAHAAPASGTEPVLEVLAATGLMSADRLVAVRARAAQAGSVARALAAEGLASPDALARILAAKHGLEAVELAASGVDHEAAKEIQLHVLERIVAIPYALEDGALRVAVADPSNIQQLDELRLATRHAVELRVAPREDILAELKRLARASGATAARLAAEEELVAEAEEEEADDLEVDDGISDAPLVRLVNSVIFQAAEDGASDIHFEPQEDALAVRFRIDGVLQEVQRIPKRMAPGVTTRLKVLAKLDIAERRKPQDGRMSLNAAAAGRLLDVRVATLPTVEGEKVVMRLLDKSKEPPTLDELGFAPAMRDQLLRLVSRPTGALLVTGPTGSGKSTTLFACLNQVNRPEINIITVEDPVEYRLAGVNQVQINQRAGLTFASALRSILRSDPDVVMVGEVRDGETAKMAIEAALTGHFVLSTLHTNDAPSAITRLQEMGVEPFLTGAAVTGVLAQRLARRLCTNCAEMYRPSADELAKARISPEVAASSEGMIFYRRRGCARCGQTGYRGRIGVYQLLVMSERLQTLAATKATREELERAALEEGMRSLWDDGLAKVAAGLTSVEELARVTV